MDKRTALNLGILAAAIVLGGVVLIRAMRGQGVDGFSLVVAIATAVLAVFMLVQSKSE